MDKSCDQQVSRRLLQTLSHEYRWKTEKTDQQTGKTCIFVLNENILFNLYRRIGRIMTNTSQEMLKRKAHIAQIFKVVCKLAVPPDQKKSKTIPDLQADFMISF